MSLFWSKWVGTPSAVESQSNRVFSSIHNPLSVLTDTVSNCYIDEWATETDHSLKVHLRDHLH